ncbi:MAG TPA: DUF559 domain-containing protein [Candidatus Dormibacteraeota bacterium]
MARRPLIPAELAHGPFTLRQARAAGLSRAHLRSPVWRRVGVGVYVLNRVPDSPLLTLTAVAKRLPPDAAFCGRSAAFLHGLDVAPCNPIEVLVPAGSGVAARDLWVSRRQLARSEIVMGKGLPATSIVRTLDDLARRLPLLEAVAIADMGLHAGLVALGDLCPRLRKHCEPAAESLMESRLRMLLVLAGLPRPQAQVDLLDTDGRLRRADLYYPEARLVIEYDGGNHRERLVEDDRRQNAIVRAGYTVLRFTAPDVLGAPQSVAAQVRAALGPVFMKRHPKPRRRSADFMKRAV